MHRANNFQKKCGKRGIGLIEALIGCSIIAVGIIALIDTYTIYVKYALANDKEVQVTYLLEEGLEALTLLRDANWTTISSLTASTTYPLYFDGSSFAIGTTSEYVNGIFLRNFAVYNVYRDGSDQIASSGTLDPNVRKATVFVSYSQSGATTTRSLSKYLPQVQ
jgi:hypothetical protein